jgi:cytochrome P450
MNPYPHYAHMRATTPVHLNEALGVWEVYGYHDIQTVLGDAKTFSSDLSDGKMMVFMDPPRHTQFRRLVARAFTSKVVADLEPSVQAITDELLDRVESTGRMDLVSDLAFALPVTVIAELLGLPVADHEKFKQWSVPAIRAAEMELMGQVPAPELVQAVDELDAYLADLIAARRDTPSNDLVSGLLAAEVDGEKLTLQEVASTCRLLLIAGFETTANLIGNTLQLLLSHPDQLARLMADPALLAPAIEEALRFNTPFQFFARIAKCDVVLGGQLIKAGQQVQPRRVGFPPCRHVRHHPRRQPPPELWPRHPLLPGCGPGPAGGARGHRHAAASLQRPAAGRGQGGPAAGVIRAVRLQQPAGVL